MALFLSVLIVCLILVASEIWYRKKSPRDEFSRKFVHITVGSFVAFWPFFLSWRQIQMLSVAFLVVIGLSKALGVFQAIHSVQRPTWGEVFFALAVGLIAMITTDKWIYAAALLQMSLADGMAAVIGARFGGQNKYLIFNQAKSLIGTATFFVVSLTILLTLNGQFPHELSLLTIFGICALATFFENVFVMGADNLVVPLLVAFVLVHA